jgi:peptidoglycan LD-endopeptidase LytH
LPSRGLTGQEGDALQMSGKWMIRGRLVAAAGLIATAAVLSCAQPPPTMAPAPDRPRETAVSEGGVTAADLERLRERQLMVPVAGVRPEQVPDNYNARRGTRIHAALDILAPRGTPVLAADAGRIFRLRSSELGGITVYATDPDELFVYYYAHLDGYRRGLAEGMQVARGEVIGYVGTTGNAPPNVPHLHFQVMKLGPGRRWWDGEPINPHPFLTFTGKAR